MNKTILERQRKPNADKGTITGELLSTDPLFWVFVNAERAMVKDKLLTPSERHFALRCIGYGWLVEERNRVTA